MRAIFWKPLVAATLIAGGAALASCTDGYGYSGVSVGVGSPGYYNSAWGDPYWGWYGDYYYPGTGVYVYDRDRRRHRWNGDQQRYWEGRRGAWRGDRRTIRRNWHDFGQHGGGRGSGRGHGRR